jgi:hypothetical protein
VIGCELCRQLALNIKAIHSKLTPDHMTLLTEKKQKYINVLQEKLEPAYAFAVIVQPLNNLSQIWPFLE